MRRYRCFKIVAVDIRLSFSLAVAVRVKEITNKGKGVVLEGHTRKLEWTDSCIIVISFIPTTAIKINNKELYTNKVLPRMVTRNYTEDDR